MVRHTCRLKSRGTILLWNFFYFSHEISSNFLRRFSREMSPPSVLIIPVADDTISKTNDTRPRVVGRRRYIWISDVDNDRNLRRERSCPSGKLSVCSMNVSSIRLGNRTMSFFVRRAQRIPSVEKFDASTTVTTSVVHRSCKAFLFFNNNRLGTAWRERFAAETSGIGRIDRAPRAAVHVRKPNGLSKVGNFHK